MLRKLTILLIVSSGVAVAQTGSGAAGRWRVHSWINGNDQVAECNFMQSGTTMRGTCTTEQGQTEITGQSSGSSVSWSYNADNKGTSSLFSYRGNLGGGKIIGRIVVSPDPDGATGGAFRADQIR
ncbi:MAG: hypothetical protein ACRYGF_10955 [Janthinobacterium lividum]